MRYLLTSFLCVFTLSLTLQSQTLSADNDGDGCVATSDLMTLLSQFGECYNSSFTCGDFVSHDGYDYSTVLIGEQCWFSENCRYLPEVSDPSIESTTEPHYSVYGYTGTDVAAAQATDNYATYGVLYNWPAVMTEGICPSGWHIPSDGEWQTMEISLGMSEAEAASEGWRGTDEGYQLKSTSGWYDGGNGTNSSGWTGLPGGYRYSGGFGSKGLNGNWWSASESGSESGSNSLRRVLDYFNAAYVLRNPDLRYYGFSARCIIDYTDECGVLNGDNSTCADCCGVPNGDGSTCNGDCGACNDNSTCLDDCGVPNGDNSTCFLSCGDDISHEGADYSTVLIGEQCWFAENCRYLPEVSPSNEGSESDPYYYVYDYQGSDVTAAQATDNYATYGVLYNWPAVMTEGICPSGWHIPSDEEWQTMEMALGMSESEAAQTGWRGSPVGDYMKSTSGWNSGVNGSNSSGWTGLPGGYRYSGGFHYYGDGGVWWSASESGSYSWGRELNGSNVLVYRGTINQSNGYSARCVRD